MKLPKNEMVVLDVAGARAVLMCNDPASETAALALGFVREGDQLTRNVVDDADRQRLVRELIGLKAIFACGRDWSPGELVEFYREQGHILGAYRAITWKSPDQYLIVDR